MEKRTLNPIEGIFAIKPEASQKFSSLQMQYKYKIIDSKMERGTVFIEPVKQDGSSTTFRTASKLTTWVKATDLNKLEKVK